MKQFSVAALVRVRDELPLIPWITANLTFADTIYVVDNESTDGSFETLLAMAKNDRRLRIKRLDTGVAHHFADDVTTRAVFDFSREGDHQWFVFVDADEFFTVKTQKVLPQFLRNLGEGRPLAVDVDFLYLAPGWSSYYVEPSTYQVRRIWNVRPRIESAPNGDRHIEVVDEFVEMSSQHRMLHVNWALERRFSRKRRWYEVRYDTPSWHPDEKYADHAPLPPQSTIYSPAGNEVKPIFLNATDW